MPRRQAEWRRAVGDAVDSAAVAERAKKIGWEVDVDVDGEGPELVTRGVEAAIGATYKAGLVSVADNRVAGGRSQVSITRSWC